MNEFLAMHFDELVCALHGIKAATSAIHSHDDMAAQGVRQLIEWTIEKAENLQEGISKHISESKP